MKKIVFTILPIWFMGLVFVIFYNCIWMQGVGSFILFLYGAISTIITVLLMYLIPIKNKIICGLVRGLLGTFIIMFSIATIVLGIFEINNDSDILIILFLSVLSALVAMGVFWFLTLGAIASFIIVDYLVKDSIREKDMEVGI